MRPSRLPSETRWTERTRHSLLIRYYDRVSAIARWRRDRNPCLVSYSFSARRLSRFQSAWFKNVSNDTSPESNSSSSRPFLRAHASEPLCQIERGRRIRGCTRASAWTFAPVVHWFGDQWDATDKAFVSNPLLRGRRATPLTAARHGRSQMTNSTARACSANVPRGAVLRRRLRRSASNACSWVDPRRRDALRGARPGLRLERRCADDATALASLRGTFGIARGG